MAPTFATTGAITANAGIVPAGSNGAVSIYGEDNTDVFIDVNGYFAPPGVGGTSFLPDDTVGFRLAHLSSFYSLSRYVYRGHGAEQLPPVECRGCLRVQCNGCSVTRSARCFGALAHGRIRTPRLYAECVRWSDNLEHGDRAHK
jgi:hypothetical protein